MNGLFGTSARWTGQHVVAATNFTSHHRVEALWIRMESIMAMPIDGVLTESHFIRFEHFSQLAGLIESFDLFCILKRVRIRRLLNYGKEWNG